MSRRKVGVWEAKVFIDRRGHKLGLFARKEGAALAAKEARYLLGIDTSRWNIVPPQSDEYAIKIQVRNRLIELRLLQNPTKPIPSVRNRIFTN